ncbi:MAG: AAA family ATPase [Clostridia bacterium]|nr:AAA family ATPase [Clostridia bacterium]
MFTQFFGLKYNPFTKEIQTDHLFVSRDLAELESRLKYLKQVRGIGLVSGEPGCGKTTALRKFASELNPAYFRPCYFALSTVTPLEFYQGLSRALGEEPKHKKVSLFAQIQDAILTMNAERHLVPVIVLDEIHLASNHVLEDIRLLFLCRANDYAEQVSMVESYTQERRDRGVEVFGIIYGASQCTPWPRFQMPRRYGRCVNSSGSTSPAH